MRKFGLIGKPLEHSFSRRYFTEKFHREEIDAVYELYELEEITDLAGLLDREPLLSGLNVTLPYKRAVIPYLDSLSPEAEAIGAVNVIRITANGLQGHNSDSAGFEISFRGALGQRTLTQAIVLGTGGASKAVLYILKERFGIPDPILVSRTPAKGQVSYEDLRDLSPGDFQAVINTTPLGMFPLVSGTPDIPYEMLDERHLAYDLVYNPEETRFMKIAAAQGATTNGGLEMLYLQAEKAWEIWNGIQDE